MLGLNPDLMQDPSLINDDPYGKGWLAKIQASNLPADLGDLLRPASPELAAHIAAERAKYGK